MNRHPLLIVLTAGIVIGGLLLIYGRESRRIIPTVSPIAVPSDNDEERRPSPMVDSTTVNTITGASFHTAATSLQPDESTWPTEAFAEEAALVLSKIKTHLKMGSLDVAATRHFSKDFASATLGELPVIHQTRMVTVRRRRFDPGLVLTANEGGARSFLANLAPRNGQTKALIKVVDVSNQGDEYVTTIRAECASSRDAIGVQRVSRWSCTWRLSNGAFQLTSAKPSWVEDVETPAKDWFIDDTQQVVGNTAAFRRQLSKGLNYWLARTEAAHGMSYFSKHGVAIADVNGDGREDLYVCQPGGLPNRLFLQLSNGRTQESAAAMGVDVLDRTSAALFVDLDNDGDQDLALSTLVGVQVFENVDHTHFSHRATLAMSDIDLQGISAADFDNDGDLDLFQLVDYATDMTRRRQGLPGFVYHDANDGGANCLFRNDIDESKSDWSFQDVTREVGLHQNNHRHSLAASWCDFNEDGSQDLYVANDYGRNCLYLNQGGYFQEVAEAAGVTDFGSGMSVSWGDFDRDGWYDLYVGNMFSSAGNRLTRQDGFLSHVPGENRALYPRFAKGNTLFRNRGDGGFDEVVGFNVEMGRWAWSSQFADIDNDGWEDLLVANGYITTEDTGDL